MNNTLGENIKKYRKALHLSQAEVGKRLGIQRSAMSKIELGQTTLLKPQQVEALCALFNCSPSDLYGIETMKVHATMPLTDDQRRLIGLVPLLTPQQVTAILNMIGAFDNAGL